MKNRNLIFVGTIGLACCFQPVLSLKGADASVDWSSGVTAIALQDGTPVAQGSLLRLGTFTNLTDAQINANGADIGFLDTYFIEFATASMGDGAGFDGYFAVSDQNNATALGLVGDQIFIWAFSTNAGNYLAAQQHGIFYMPFSADSDWDFPNDVDPPANGTTIDIADLMIGDFSTTNAFAAIPWGGFGTGSAFDIPYFNLQVIPEPSTYALIAMGLGLIGLRFRRRK